MKFAHEKQSGKCWKNRGKTLLPMAIRNENKIALAALNSAFNVFNL